MKRTADGNRWAMSVALAMVTHGKMTALRDASTLGVNGVRGSGDIY